MSEVIPGAIFGRLTVIGKTEQRSSNRAFLWRCKCDCGNAVFTTASKLRSGSVTQCGCQKTSVIVGERYGKLTVKERTENQGKNAAFVCRCDCGSENVFTGKWLKARGDNADCGCTKFTGVAPDQKFGRLTVLESTNLITAYGNIIWKCQCDCGNTGYFTNFHLKSLGGSASCGCLTGKKYAGWQSESKNRDVILNKNNTSGVNGVYFSKKKNKWCADIRFRGEKIFLGVFENIEKAAVARRKAEELLA